MSAETELTKALEEWKTSMRSYEHKRSDLRAAVRRAVNEGMSQAEVGRLLGWPRQRVNDLLG